MGILQKVYIEIIKQWKVLTLKASQKMILKKTIGGIFRKITRDHLWVKRELMLEYFKKNF